MCICVCVSAKTSNRNILLDISRMCDYFIKNFFAMSQYTEAEFASERPMFGHRREGCGRATPI